MVDKCVGNDINNDFIDGLKPGDYVYGDLRKVGWVVIKGAFNETDDNDVFSAIKNISNMPLSGKMWENLQFEKDRQIYYGTSTPDSEKFKNETSRPLLKAHDKTNHVISHYLHSEYGIDVNNMLHHGCNF